MENKIDIDVIEKLQASWNFPTSIKFGVGIISSLPDICKSMGINKPLLVTDQGLVDQPFIKRIQDNNNSNGIITTVFSDVKSNPTGSNIHNGVEIYHQGKHDGVIAVGGGSGLDAGKAIALMSGQEHSIWDFEDKGENWLRVNVNGMAPVIAIPTTAGTGSEVGRSSVILDEDASIKKIIFHPNMLPDLVIEDPELTIGLPDFLTAATGVDAFVHCLEAFCAPAYHPMADGIALEGMRLIKQWLPVAYKDGSNVIARSHLLVASTMGATAFQKGLGGVHALAHPLGALFDKHHGLLNAILLPYVLIKNKEMIEHRIIHLSRYLELHDISFKGFISWVLAFRKALNIPNDLSELGIDISQKTLIAKMATEDACAASNPILFSQEQYADIFVSAVEGKLEGYDK